MQKSNKSWARLNEGANEENIDMCSPRQIIVSMDNKSIDEEKKITIKLNINYLVLLHYWQGKVCIKP